MEKSSGRWESHADGLLVQGGGGGSYWKEAVTLKKSLRTVQCSNDSPYSTNHPPVPTGAPRPKAAAGRQLVIQTPSRPSVCLCSGERCAWRLRPKHHFLCLCRLGRLPAGGSIPDLPAEGSGLHQDVHTPDPHPSGSTGLGCGRDHVG